jgi:hypothetical protein
MKFVFMVLKMSYETPTMKYPTNSKRVVKHCHQFKTEETVSGNDEKPGFVDDKDYFSNNINRQNLSRLLRKAADEIDRLNKSCDSTEGYSKRGTNSIEMNTQTNFRGLDKTAKKTIEMLADSDDEM